MQSEKRQADLAATQGANLAKLATDLSERVRRLEGVAAHPSLTVNSSATPLATADIEAAMTNAIRGFRPEICFKFRREDEYQSHVSDNRIQKLKALYTKLRRDNIAHSQELHNVAARLYTPTTKLSRSCMDNSLRKSFRQMCRSFRR
ncbi:hypothetical protein NW768_011572 [Fusarium equiseti]|uniref:Uncharacterized protein n=1 Tax=Fusarium equiseti TaxID=61235 RepID=A0ABQ8QXX1_FUSEQ|nr:hypothetical protein NW768_011572 [Fusarium equiseti]